MPESLSINGQLLFAGLAIGSVYADGESDSITW